LSSAIFWISSDRIIQGPPGGHPDRTGTPRFAVVLDYRLNKTRQTNEIEWFQTVEWLVNH
jgi:hypothetical protein